jgi:SAM-dependent methyltransferase
MSEIKVKTRGEDSSRDASAARWAFLRRPPQFLDRLFYQLESSQILKRIKPYINEGMVVADIGCGWGSYTFALADMVGTQGKVYSVDLSKNCIGSIQKKVYQRGYHHIKAYASTAADLSFIDDNTVDFVFANGLICSMQYERDAAVSEIKRILKPDGKAYISLGAKPPLGLVDEAEWGKILAGFRVESGGVYQKQWAVVALSQA